MSNQTTNRPVDSTPSAATAPRPSTPYANAAIAVLITAIGMGAAVWSGGSMMKGTHDQQRAAFENVLQMPSDELDTKSVAELRGYLHNVKKAGNSSIVFGNVSGYDMDIVEREYNQINDLIKAKTDN